MFFIRKNTNFKSYDESKIIYPPPRFLLLFLALLLFSCTSDDLENNSTNPVINQLKNDLNLDQFKNKNIAENLVVNWQTLSRIDKDGFEIYEIEAIEKNPSKIESNLFQSELKYELISIKNKNEIHSYLVEVYSNLNYSSFSNSIQNLKHFTGTLNVYELNGTLINQLVVFNGKSTNPSINNHLTQLNTAINLFSSKNNLTGRVPECSTIFFVNVIVNVRTDHYSYITVGTYTQKALQYSSYSTYNRIEPMSVPCGGSEESYANHYINTYRDVMDVQITNELTGKAKCLNDLLDKDGDSFVQNLLANFEGESEFDITIVSKEHVVSNQTGNEINGRTLYTENIGSTLITIEISTSKTNERAALVGARIILHEYIHADMYRKLYTTEVTNQEVLDFKKTYEAYGNQHGAMGALYINSMKDALKAFHKNVLTDDYNKYINFYGEAPSDTFYEAMAWGGLRDSDVKSWTDLSPEKKAAIETLASRVTGFSKTVPCPN